MAMSTDPNQSAAKEAILALLARRAPGKTICPSEAARTLAPDGWREQMDVVRQAAATLEAQGIIDICQGGESILLSEARGPIRLRLRGESPSDR
ncbi:MAG: DUF3253 domain-containing protein [Pseudomonadota bacterium]